MRTTCAPAPSIFASNQQLCPVARQPSAAFPCSLPVHLHLQPEQDHCTCNQNRIKHLQPEQDQAPATRTASSTFNQNRIQPSFQPSLQPSRRSTASPCCLCTSPCSSSKLTALSCSPSQAAPETLPNFTSLCSSQEV